ncbi:MAG TPA: DUF1499 domain-containing protein [Thermoanaerobaculia bacterium]|nr:DUF1499 domain-containing protein [Thermoanaerobaculia bacterium]
MNPHLKPCPSSPNCVSTEATDKTHAIAPYRYSGPAGDAMQKLLGILKAMPRTKIVSSDGSMIRAEFKTAWFGFTDDGIFVADDTTKSIRFRSASRVGRSDLGVNRRRMEAIRAAFAKEMRDSGQ